MLVFNNWCEGLDFMAVFDPAMAPYFSILPQIPCLHCSFQVLNRDKTVVVPPSDLTSTVELRQLCSAIEHSVDPAMKAPSLLHY